MSSDGSMPGPRPLIASFTVVLLTSTSLCAVCSCARPDSPPTPLTGAAGPWYPAVVAGIGSVQPVAPPPWGSGLSLLAAEGTAALRSA